MRKTIPYVNGTINPVSGCVKFSRGCQNCYAHIWAQRFRGGDFSLKYFPEKLEIIRKKKSGLWFVGSMTDLFQDGIEAQEVAKILDAITQSKAKFLFLTKRAFNMHSFFYALGTPPENLGIGVTAEGQAEWNERVPILLGIKASMRWVSVEPILEHVKPDGLERLDWLIAGPETGRKARPYESKWMTDLWIQSKMWHVPFFDKRVYADNCREWPKGWGLNA